MGAVERTVRVTGGAVAATGVSRSLGGVSRSSDAAAAEVAEAITPDGVRVRVPISIA